MADVNDDDAPATKRDLRELEARLDAKQQEIARATQRELSQEIARAAGATQDEMRRWFSVLLEKHDSDVKATNGNVAQLRTDFEAHRDDTKVHVTRAPRRRSR